MRKNLATVHAPTRWAVASGTDGTCPVGHTPTVTAATWSAFVDRHADHTRIVLPGGCLYVDGNLELSGVHDFVLTGSGRSPSTRTSLVETTPGIEGYAGFINVANGSARVEISNLVLHGNVTTGQPPDNGQAPHTGVYIGGGTGRVHDVTIAGSTITGFRGDAVYVGGTSSRVVLADNVLGRVGRDAVSIMNATDVSVTGNTLWDSGLLAVDIEPNASGIAGAPSGAEPTSRKPGAQRISVVDNTISGLNATLNASATGKGLQPDGSFEPFPFVDDVTIAHNTWPATCTPAPSEQCAPPEPVVTKGVAAPGGNPMGITFKAYSATEPGFLGSINRVLVDQNHQLSPTAEAKIRMSLNAGPDDIENVTVTDNTTASPTLNLEAFTVCPMRSSGDTATVDGKHVDVAANPMRPDGSTNDCTAKVHVAPDGMSAVQFAVRHSTLVTGHGPTMEDAVAVRKALWTGFSPAQVIVSLINKPSSTLGRDATGADSAIRAAYQATLGRDPTATERTEAATDFNGRTDLAASQTGLVNRLLASKEYRVDK